MTTIAGDGRTNVDAETEAGDLREVRRRRAELLESIKALELALAAPGRQERWPERVSVALLELSGDFRDHVDLTEGPSGLYSRVIRASPRLAHAVARLTQEHETLVGLIEGLIRFVGQGDRSAMLGDMLPGDALPGDMLPVDALPGDALPGDALPGDPLAGDPLAGDPLAVDRGLGDPDEVRERGNALLAALVRHRQRGADLVWEAFSVDIGGQD